MTKYNALSLLLLATACTQGTAYPTEHQSTELAVIERNPLFGNAEDEVKNFILHLTHCRESNSCDQHENFNASLLNLKTIQTKFENIFNNPTCNSCEKNADHCETDEAKKHHAIITNLINATPEALAILNQPMNATTQAEIQQALDTTATVAAVAEQIQQAISK
jgi:hypothetical protein